MTGLISRWRDRIERERLQPDLARAARATVGFMGPMLAAYAWQLPLEGMFAAIAAQNVGMVDVRGSYPLRLGLLLFMAAVLGGGAWLGSVAGADLPLALAATLVLMLAGGVWRHLSAEYGPSLATASFLLFLIALAHPDGGALAYRHFLAALAGGVWGVGVQVALWPFRAQHPLRRTVADSWLALSDLLAAMSPEENPPAGGRHTLIAERQAQLRTALDHATGLLAPAAGAGRRPYLRQLEELNLAAARLGTRFLAFNVALETLMARPGFPDLAPSFAPLVTSLTNTTRTIALTIVSRQPSHLAAGEVRLRRLGNLLQALQDRVLAQTAHAPDAAQLTTIMRQIGALLPGIQAALHATTERADERAAFSLELFDLQTWTLRPLASALNLRWHVDPALARFVARATVLQLAGVAAFQLTGLERGYWLPLTILVVLQPDYGSTRQRAGQRVVGTLAGSALASVLLWLPLPTAALFTLTALTMFGFAFWLKRAYGIAVFCITLFVVLITEVSAPVTFGFTLERLGFTAAGGLLALLAAQLFWPVWERNVFPGLLARALRANRDYLRLLGARVAAGGSYDEPAIAAKRAAEVANSALFTSLQRMAADPKSQQAGLEEAAALANGNQRLTRALTVVALHLAPGHALDRPELARFADLAGAALDHLADSVAAPPDPARLAELRHALDALALPAPTGTDRTSLEHSVYAQFARCVTELSAMLLAAGAASTDRAPPFPADAAGGPAATP